MSRRYLSRQFEDEFPPWIQERGEALRQRGVVEFAHRSPLEVELCVRDDLPYTVTLKLRHDGQPFGACECAAGRRGSGRCRHLWAGLRATEENGLLMAPATAARQAAPATRAAGAPAAVQRPATTKTAPSPAPHEHDWRERLSIVHSVIDHSRYAARASTLPSAPFEILYLVDPLASQRTGQLTLVVVERRALPRGGWSKTRPLRVDTTAAEHAPDPADREALSLLLGAWPRDEWALRSNAGLGPSVVLDGAVAPAILPRLCSTGRCLISDEAATPVVWDDGPPWELHLAVRREEDDYVIGARLHRGDARRKLVDTQLIVASGLVLFKDGSAARLDHGGLFPWVAALRGHPKLRVPCTDGWELAAELLVGTPTLTRLDLPDELRMEEVRVPPVPRLIIRRGARVSAVERLVCELHFDYAGTRTESHHDGAPTVLDRRLQRLVRRDLEAERRAHDQLAAAGVKTRASRHAYAEVQHELAARRLPQAVRQLVGHGWHVEAEGEIYRRPGTLRVGVTSAIDWFDIEGEVDFDGHKVPFPEVLGALRSGSLLVPLGDGSLGMLPEEWLKRFGLLARLAEPADGRARFRATQVGLLDALLAEQSDVSTDAAFERARARLRTFEGLVPSDAPPGFTGELRAYQREGLAWLRFLDEFGFGGCLADDMGLGKTVQVLALLAGRHIEHGAPRPSLVVAPRSLIFNWKTEAARFVPALRVLDHTGLERRRAVEAFDGQHVVLTTYGTLRRDVLLLKDVEFECVVLDEAQAVKNASSETAKAARLLRGRQRLALSGTPVENHLGELWSLFEFLNPGMLGRVSALDPAAGDAGAEERAVLARALRPFILRRTKEQVARDLPPKTEQTLVCELDGEQRRLYDELREHYRAALLGKTAGGGLEDAPILVLEALLRLRQAACHPALLDPARADQPGAKLDALLPLLGEVLEEDHKVLVFSQFTRLLALVRARLEAQGIAYEYLDGRTRDRAARVERFQSDPACRVFLVSLKAGGVGLNLTAAEYVFLLDPWWNPAVEAQAIDRAHRIGQDKPVFAYRLIAKDTVEEKVLELQQSKRELADAIIAADGGPLRNLKREDLELLLS